MVFISYLELQDIHFEWSRDEGVTAAWIEKEGQPDLDMLDYLTDYEIEQLNQRGFEEEALAGERHQSMLEDAAEARAEAMRERREDR